MKSHIRNADYTKEYNRKQILRFLVSTPLSRADLARKTGLTRAAISIITDELLQSGLIQGKNPRLLARELTKKFDVSVTNAERLMRTELARVQTEAQRQSFERNGFEEYEFIANGGCCDICAALNGKHFKVAKMMPGENAPPMHPYCRCSTAAYEDSKEYKAWLKHLEKGGTTEEWAAVKQKALTNIVKGDIISAGAVTGALNNKNDPEGLKRQAHAEKYYLSMRNSEKEDIVSAISKNSSIDSAIVSKMFEHLIINQYDLGQGGRLECSRL